MVRAVGTEIFNQRVRLEQKTTEVEDMGRAGATQEHTVFTVYFLDEEENDKNKKKTSTVSVMSGDSAVVSGHDHSNEVKDKIVLA